MAGKTLDELWPETGRIFEDLCRQVLVTGEPYHAVDEMYMIRRFPDGPLEPAYFNWSLFRVRLPGDEGWAILNTTWETTERRQAEEALAAAKAAAEAANIAKSQFLANMSHELRTPMNAILGMIDVALPKAIDPTVEDCLQTARSSADLLLTLLNDLLDSAKIESGKLELEAAAFSPRRMLDQIARILSVEQARRGFAFTAECPTRRRTRSSATGCDCSKSCSISPETPSSSPSAATLRSVFKPGWRQARPG